MTNQPKAGDFVTPTVRLLHPLAEGGMGRVWVAEHLGLHAQVVVKLMADEMAARPDGAERFAREAAVAAAIKSPHVVQVFDHGVTADGVPYIVMELLEGQDLGAYLAERGRMDPLDVVALVVQVGKALAKAHKAAIVHRDIKPDNIFLCDTDGGELFVKLLDFGTAKRDDARTSRTTVPGQIMGTPYYMSPEQSVGAVEIDERSDIWSLGVVVFETLTGQKPFDGTSVGAITIAIHGPLPRMSDLLPDLPPAVEAWFSRACAQESGDRFASAREMASAFVEAMTGSAPIEQPTESLLFAPSASLGDCLLDAPPARRSLEPLSASLPAPGVERKATTIAAGAVMVAAALAMIAIVAGRGPETAERAPASAPTHAAQIAPAPTPETQSPPPAPSVPPFEPEPTLANVAEPPTAAAPAKPAPPKVGRVPATPPRSMGAAPRRRSATGHEDDDLVQLTKVGAQHSEPPAAPSAAPPSSERTSPAPALPAP